MKRSEIYLYCSFIASCLIIINALDILFGGWTLTQSLANMFFSLTSLGFWILKEIAELKEYQVTKNNIQKGIEGLKADIVLDPFSHVITNRQVFDEEEL